MSLNLNQEYHSLASNMAEDMKERATQLKILVDVAISTFNQSATEYLDKLFSEHQGLDRCINSIRANGLAKNPDEFNSYWLPVNEDQFDIDVSDIDFRTAFVLFDIIKSRLTDLHTIPYVDFEQNQKLIVPIERSSAAIARLYFDVDRQTCCFLNDRDQTFLDLPVMIDQAKIDLSKLDYGSYVFTNIYNLDDVLNNEESKQPTSLVSKLGSSNEFNSLLVTAMVYAMKDNDFDMSVIDLLEPRRIESFSKSSQSLLDIVNQTYPDRFDTFLECAYSISLRSKPVLINFLPSMLIQTWLNRDVVTSDHKNLMLRLIELNQFKDKGYLATDRVPILISHYDEVKDHQECLLLSDSINQEIESIFDVEAALKVDDYEELSVFTNTL